MDVHLRTISDLQERGKNLGFTALEQRRRVQSVGHSRVERPFTYAFGRVQVMQTTNLFRDTLTSRIKPVYGLTTLQAFIYFQKYPNDGVLLKTVVTCVW